MATIHRVLVANRSEIAIRVFRACTELHKQTVAIYSEEDTLSLHRYKADEAYLVGKGKGPVEAYLDIEGIIEIAKRKDVDAIHPGYGFLAENPEFAQRCEEEGIVFIGPTPEHLRLFGDKVASRALAQEAGLPLVPATPRPITTLEEALLFAKQYGYPLIVKAVAGGGGRGMRVVRNRSELESALERARSEAEKAFGNPAVFLERYIEDPKHIEVQILADKYGNMVHLFERDCSVQRRHQKVVEIAPSLALTEEKRQEICEAALRLMRRVNYVNAATVEFLYDSEGNFYFLEVNPRIQVEHTITELITGIDIVQAQIRIAEGYKLSDPEIGIPSQEAVTRRGYAIQCRITTEDPANNFVPDRGRILAYRSAAGFGVRLDAGNGHTGAVITPHYDSLLVKVSTWALTFENAASKMLRSLREFRIRGLKTNIPFLENVVQHPRFLSGDCTTTFIDNTPELFEFPQRRDRGTKLLSFIAHKTVNLGPDFKKVDKKEFREPPIPAISYKVPYPEGTKNLLDRLGPKGFAEWVKEQKRLLITDTTFRDAHQSLLATRMRTYDMLQIAEATAKLAPQLFSLEMWGGATFDTAMRFNMEDPWERLERLRALIPNICFQMLLRGSNAVGYANYPDNVVQEFVKEAAAAGIDIFRIFDSLNWIEGMRVAMDAANEAGKVVEAAICYTGDILDPSRTKYTLQYYVDLAKKLEAAGAHILGIKDMAGLLKPYAAEKLIRTLKEEIGIPIHLHTHDTSGNSIATVLKAVEAGVDIVDLAISAMSGLTSQPSLNALVAALERTERDTGLDGAALQQLDEYWEAVRRYYAPFEMGLKSGTAEVYVHEMPGGQYSNLYEQAKALGLEHRWKEIKQAYVTANKLMGDIVKVTPSSKAVGDLALFMVQNNLDEKTLMERADELDFPDSVITFFQGLMGQPMGGFPKELQRKVLKGREPITCRPGELMDPVDFEAVRKELEEEFEQAFTHRDAISAVLYPSVFRSFIEHKIKYSDTSVIDTPTFFYGLNVGEETRIEMEPGKTLVVKLTAVGELLEDGTRMVYFELNGQPREVRVADESATVKRVERPKADRRNPSHVAATMPGSVIQVLVSQGDKVAKGQALAVIEAMKVEQTIQAHRAGTVAEVLVKPGDSIQAGDLLLVVQPADDE
ncbi:MAG TPA: pyruvate carboxylase [Limnochordia bacterium]|nr:pyruvate carboxylase [Limnochordia bacterium]